VRSVDAPADFHSTRWALNKLYRYTVFTGRVVPAARARFVYHFWRGCDVQRMRAAAAALVGTHDFSAFESSGSQRRTKVRHLMRCEVSRSFDEVRFDLQADGFLYNMVRNIVGTLLEIGRAHWPIEKAAEVLASRDRRKAGPLAPPTGLCLQWVRYPPRLAADGTIRTDAPVLRGHRALADGESIASNEER